MYIHNHYDILSSKYPKRDKQYQVSNIGLEITYDGSEITFSKLCLVTSQGRDDDISLRSRPNFFWILIP